MPGLVQCSTLIVLLCKHTLMARAVEALTRKRKQKCRKADSDFSLVGYVNNAYSELAHYLARDLASKIYSVVVASVEGSAILTPQFYLSEVLVCVLWIVNSLEKPERPRG